LGYNKWEHPGFRTGNGRRYCAKLNRDVMARYRPPMRRYYYDPTKYRPSTARI